MSTASAIRNIAKAKTFEEYDIPEWGVTVRIKSLSGNQRAAFFDATDGGTNIVLTELWHLLLCSAVFEADSDDLVFESDDVDFLLEHADGSIVARLCERIMEISGLTEDAEEEAGKDSSATETGSATPSAPSISGSRAS